MNQICVAPQNHYADTRHKSGFRKFLKTIRFAKKEFQMYNDVNSEQKATKWHFYTE